MRSSQDESMTSISGTVISGVIFANMVPNMRLKIKNSKKRILAIFSLHLFSNLAKFQLHSSIRAKVDSKNVFLRYHDLKFRDPFFTKIGLFLPNIFQNPKNLLDFAAFHGLVSGDT